MTCKDMLDWANALHPPVMWLLVIAGWIVVSRQNDGRESRKELRARLDGLVTKVNCLLDESTVFYMAAGDDPSCEMKRASLVRNLGQISSVVSELAGGNSNSPLLAKTVALRQAITLHDFDEKRRTAAAYSDQKLVEIRSAGQELVSCLETAFASKYKNSRITIE